MAKELKYTLETYKDIWNEIKYGLFDSDETMSDEKTDKEFQERYFPNIDEDFEMEAQFNKVLRYIYGNE